MTFLEAMQALMDGKKISHIDWAEDEYICKNGNYIHDQDGKEAVLEIDGLDVVCEDKFFIFEDPLKEKLDEKELLETKIELLSKRVDQLNNSTNEKLLSLIEKLEYRLVSISDLIQAMIKKSIGGK